MLASSRRQAFATYAAVYQALRRKPPLTGVAGAPLKGELPRVLRQHRTIAEASAVESPIRQETIGFPAHFFARAHNFKPPGRACQPEADSPMRT